MKSLPVSMNKPVSIIMALVLALVALMLGPGMAGAQVEPASPDIDLAVKPDTPVVNDGTMQLGIYWRIHGWTGEPDYYTLELFAPSEWPSGTPALSETSAGGADLPDVDGQGPSIDVYNPENTLNQAAGTPYEWPDPTDTYRHHWTVPLGAEAGTWRAFIQAFTDDGQLMDEASTLFFVIDKAHLTTVIDTPADDSTQSVSSDFEVSATITNTGASPATGVQALLGISANAHVVAGANPYPLGTIAADGGTAVATWTLHCDSEGDVVITVTPSGTDGTSGEEILQENIEGDTITVHQEQLVGDLQICKYEDLNGNGVNDGEPPLVGWLFDITGPQGFADQVTLQDGCILLEGIPVGLYTITEQLQPGWRNTDPGEPAPYDKQATVTSGQTAQVEFGNQELGDLVIFKFEDLDQDGVYDPGDTPPEQGLNDWAFNIAGVGMRTTTGGGYITEPDLVPGSYLVTETVKSGWTCTTDNPQTANVPTGGTADTLEFGNYERPEMVPSLSQWGIIAMIVVFGGLLVWTVRRRLVSRTG